MRNIDEIIVHCSATRPGWYENRPIEDKVAEIRRWHVEDRGWNDIGYHVLIDRDGSVAEGRPMSVQGAHVSGHNVGTVGVCLIGGHGGNERDQFADNFTAAQDKALRDVIRRIKDRHPIKRITGHNEYAAKACPCFMVSDWLADKPTKAKTAGNSTTLRAVGAAAVSGVGGIATGLSQLEPTAQYIVLGFAGVAALSLIWIARERLKKLARGI